MNKFDDSLDCIWVNNYYVILKYNGSIEIYDDKLRLVKNVDINIKYSSISYDEKENIFYLMEFGNNQLYKNIDLENSVPEKINSLMQLSEKINKISYCKYYNTILITTQKKVYSFDLCKKNFKKIYEVRDLVIDTNDCTAPLGFNKENEMFLIDTICCGKDIYISYEVSKINYISKLVNNNLDEIVYKTLYPIKAMFIKDQEIWLLITKCCKQEIIPTNIECSCDCDDTDTCKCQVIYSIAMIERSIAKILNSESSKIKEAIERAENIEDLLCVNDSVKDTIYYITILEFILTEKLKIAIKNTR